jgi:hypothetical protein
MCTLILGWICAGVVMAHTPCIQSVNVACSPEFPLSFLFYLLQHSIITWPFSQTEVCLPIVSSLSPSTMHSNYCDLFIFLTDLIPLLMSLKSHKWFTTISACTSDGSQAQCSSSTNRLLHYPTHPSVTAQLMISGTKFTLFHIPCLWHWEWLQSIKAWFHTQYHDLFSHKLGVIT